MQEIGFIKQELSEFLHTNPFKLIEEFSFKLKNYKEDRDFFYKDATSNLAIFLRFGIISPRQVFNKIKALDVSLAQKDFFIRQLFWREFYHYILFHFPNSQNKNFKNIKVQWINDKEDFKAWCDGNTGVPIVDAAMRYLNQTGQMHNRLRMIVSSYLTKNLLIDWRWGEKYFASKLLDYEASSNIGSWQWAASTGCDSVPYFRVFNPYLQSKKFDKDAIFIKSVIPELKNLETKQFHIENAAQKSISTYPKQLVNISFSRQRAIQVFKEANNRAKIKN